MVKFSTDNGSFMISKNIKYMIMKHTGDEIVSYVLVGGTDYPENPKFYYLFYPVKIQNFINPMDGKQSFMMTEWISKRISDDEGFEVRADDILIIADVEDSLKKGYIRFKDNIVKYENKLKENPIDIEIKNEDYDHKKNDNGIVVDIDNISNSENVEDFVESDLNLSDEEIIGITEKLSDFLKGKKKVLH